MVIQFNKDMELEVFYDENQVEAEIEKFTASTQMEVDICSTPPDEPCEVQLVTGGVTFVTPAFWENVKILTKD